MAACINRIVFAPLLFTAVSLAGTGAAAAAELTDTLRDCRSISNNDQRLACFDKLAAGLPAPQARPAQPSAWKVEVAEKKIAGKAAYAILKSVNAEPNTVGVLKHADLVIRCLEGKTELYVNGPVFYGLQGVTVKYRVDNGKVQTLSASSGARGDAFFVPNPAKFIAGNLLGKKSLVMSASVHNRQPIELEFPIDGIDDAVKPVRDACKW